MSNAANSKGSLRRMTALSLISSIVVVLTILQNFVRFGPVSITLALCPIIVGGALYGPGAGALLGGVFGVVTLISGIMGWDGGAVMLMMNANPIALIIVCIGKGVAAGWCAALVYRMFEKKNMKLGVFAAGVVCPVVNTGIFIAAMLLCFKDLLAQWAGGKDVISYAILGLTGVNFLVELAVNMILASAITLIIKYAKNRR